MNNINKLSRIPLGASKWVEFVKAMPDATIFHQPAWGDFLCECYGLRPSVIAIEDVTGRIIAGIPMVEVSSLLGGKKWVSLPFTDHCAPLFLDSNVLSLLTSGIIDQYREKEAQSIELRWQYPISSEIELVAEYTLSKVKLSRDPGEVAARIRRTHFNQIKMAQTRGVWVQMGTTKDQMRDFYNLHSLNRRRLGVPVQPSKFFKLMQERLLEQGHGFIISAYKDNKCVAAALFLHWGRSLIYKYAASSEVGRELYAMDLILWNAINWGCEQGKDILDLGRSSIDNNGLRKFKKRWGAEESPLVYSFIPYKSSSITSDRFIGLSKTVIQHSPVWVCRLIGELLYKHSI